MACAEVFKGAATTKVMESAMAMMTSQSADIQPLVTPTAPTMRPNSL
jgi:hypothetical protein